VLCFEWWCSQKEWCNKHIGCETGFNTMNTLKKVDTERIQEAAVATLSTWREARKKWKGTKKKKRRSR
jgi:hypothetical protein